MLLYYESYTLHAVLQCHESVSGGGVFGPTQVMWYHSSQPSHCIMLSRHSGISQLQNTSISWYGNHGYGGTGVRLCECGKGVSFCLVKHLAKCCRILSCSNSISSKLNIFQTVPSCRMESICNCIYSTVCNTLLLWKIWNMYLDMWIYHLTIFFSQNHQLVYGG